MACEMSYDRGIVLAVTNQMEGHQEDTSEIFFVAKLETIGKPGRAMVRRSEDEVDKTARGCLAAFPGGGLSRESGFVS